MSLANRERGSYTVDNIIVAKDKAEFNVSMSTISMKAADDAYGANHPNLTDDLKNYLQSNGQVTDGWAVSMALSLYLDFINLFLNILRLFARRN